MVVIQLAGIALLLSVSLWVWRDAERRGMSPRWGLAVGLLLIVFLPLYFLVRKPMKCRECGKVIASSLSLCEKCEELQASEPGAGRAGRIFG